MPGKLTEEESQRVESNIATLDKARQAWCRDMLKYLGCFKWAAAQGQWEVDNLNMAMNCWGAPIYVARRTGRLKKKTVVDFDLLPFQYTELSGLHASQRAAYEFLKGNLGKTGEEGIPGDILLFFIQGMGGLTGSSGPQDQMEYLKSVPFDKCPVHCAVSMGPGECVSLWSTPNNYDKLQLCKTSVLKDAIELDRKTTCQYSSIAPFWLAAAKNRSPCYITTAVCQSKNLPDDCHVLTTLRWFRDTILAETAIGRRHISMYYATAPQIVAAINQKHDATQIYDHLFQEYIKPAVTAVENGEHGVAHRLLQVMVEMLQRQHGPMEIKFPDSQYQHQSI
jgi:hypothetical protein